jgi:hypothetical protein
LEVKTTCADTHGNLWVYPGDANLGGPKGVCAGLSGFRTDSWTTAPDSTTTPGPGTDPVTSPLMMQPAATMDSAAMPPATNFTGGRSAGE